MKQERVYLWSGVVMLALSFAGLLIAGWLPPPSPTASAQSVAHDYQAHTTAIRAGMALAMFGAGFLGPFVAAIAAQVSRMSRTYASAAYCQLAVGSLFVLVFIFPWMIFEVAAFRPFRSPEITQTLNDAGWVILLATAGTVFVELLLLGLAIAQDTSEDPIFPKWAAPYNAAVAVAMAAGIGAVFAIHGPWAWNGFFPFYLPLAAWGSWMCVMTILLRRAILKADATAA